MKRYADLFIKLFMVLFLGMGFLLGMEFQDLLNEIEKAEEAAQTDYYSALDKEVYKTDEYNISRYDYSGWADQYSSQKEWDYDNKSMSTKRGYYSYDDDSYLSVSFKKKCNGEPEWFLMYHAKDELDASTAYAEMDQVSRVISLLAPESVAYSDAICNICIFLPDERYIMGTEYGPVLATTSEGTVISRKLPDWFVTNTEPDEAFGDFLAESVFRDFMYDKVLERQ